MRALSGLTLAVASATAVVAGAAPAPFPFEALDPQRWQEPTRARSPQMEALVGRLRRALLAEDAARIAATVADMRRELGSEVSRPEVRLDYVGPPDPAVRPADDFLRWWLDDCARRVGREPWDAAAAATRAGRVPPRLRDSQRMADAYLATARLLGPAAGAPFRERGLAGARYILSCQTNSGVFGYPYDPSRTDRLGLQAKKMVERGEWQGRRMVEGIWIVDDLDGAELQFDHGVCGLLMFDAYALSGDPTFRTSGVRAAEWALTRPLVPNWNYNAFSARLLARGHLVTRDARYLAAARRKFELGVLPGQTETGRWFDPHNTRTQYHAILCTALVDYVELLAAASDPALPAARAAARLALDNLAMQTVRFGASNTSEMLTLEALHRATVVLGRQPDWDRAARVTLNVLATDLQAKLLRDLRRLPEAVPFGLLQLRPADG